MKIHIYFKKDVPNTLFNRYGQGPSLIKSFEHEDGFLIVTVLSADGTRVDVINENSIIAYEVTA